ncbi:MAG TPA: DUF2147 domain-containing protein [Bryobacteraceae bacterium]|jgi:uncharacterized protein (DUF2147 family)|nr:DUF2147 domain-containing protein [Bryobacteraceae bacterium]
MWFTVRYPRHISPGLLAIFLAAAPALFAGDLSPAGLWKAFDDHTHQARGTVRIYEENGLYFGKIESSFKPEELAEHCFKCNGDRKDAPILGLLILRNVRKNGSEYDGGDILDPENGSVYRCRLTLSADGQQLLVRGYLGFAIFGRTQTWLRLPEPPLSQSSIP